MFYKFSESVQNFQIFTFSRIFSRFSSAKISDDLFYSHRPKISTFPYFPCFSTFPGFREDYYFQLHCTLTNCPPCFRKNHLLFTYFMCVSFSPPTLTMMHLCITLCT